MTTAMPDSIYPGNIPMGYPAVLGYADGKWNTAPRLPQLFPGTKVVSLTVTGATTEADGIDCEPGNPNAAQAAAWIARKLAADPGSRPVAYADLASPAYSMGEVITGLAHLGIGRREVRLLTAHYGDGEHVCAPAHGCRDASGNVITFTADGTQWTSSFPGIGGALIDMSLLADDFFGTPAPPTTVKTPPTTVNWTETTVQQLPVVQQGATGDVVRTVQGLCNARVPGKNLAMDGIFGPATSGTVKAIQTNARIAADGIVGPATWPVLLGV